MDHAGWVEENNAAGKRLAGAADRRRAKDGRGYLAAPETLNPFQRRAINILGIVGCGIYNAPISWETVYWLDNMIAVAWRRDLSTFDFSELTQLVFLSHDARIRVCISPKSCGHIEITMSPRHEGGSMSRHHPNLDEAVAAFRGWFKPDHPINYVAPASSEVPA